VEQENEGSWHKDRRRGHQDDGADVVIGYRPQPSGAIRDSANPKEDVASLQTRAGRCAAALPPFAMKRRQFAAKRLARVCPVFGM
jgi:hypothetical protein